MTEELGSEEGAGEMEPDISFEQLQTAAGEEKWELVDKHIGRFCDDPTVIEWVMKTGLGSKDGNLRDLAVSILERSGAEFDEKTKSDLLEKRGSDENQYVRYRAAFALFAHGDRSPQVIQTLQEAREDKDVREIAEGYLSQIDSSQ
jgi:HEAT repeat protein